MQQSSFITLYIVYNIEKVLFLQNIFYRKNDVKTKIIFYLFDLMLYLDFIFIILKKYCQNAFFSSFPNLFRHLLRLNYFGCHKQK